MKTRKTLALLLGLLLLWAAVLPAFAEEEDEDPLARFLVRHGSRAEKKIAVTVDDSFDLNYTWKIRDLFAQYGVVGTFFPIGKQIHVEDRDEWQKILDNGNEIGSHNDGHYKMGGSDLWDILAALGRYQEALDKALGYHYDVHCFRPPFGNTTNKNGSDKTFRNALTTFGFSHAILWDVSQTDPDKCYPLVKNGSILLFHARARDYRCLENLIPRLLADGYEFVTVSQLLGFGPNETSPELYVFQKSLYRKE